MNLGCHACSILKCCNEWFGNFGIKRIAGMVIPAMEKYVTEYIV